MKQFLVYTKFIVSIAILLGVISILLVSCMEAPLSPVAPSLDTYMSIPVVDITRLFGDFAVKDTIRLKQNIDSTYSYITSQHADSVGIDTIKVQPKPSSQQVGVGQFTVSSFSVSQNMSATSFGFPSSGSLPLVPAVTKSISPILINDTTEFNYIAISSGSLTLTITNNLPITIDFPKPIVLRNNWSSPLDTLKIAEFSVTGQLNPGESTNIPAADISGKFLRGLLRTDSIQFHTNGSATSVTFTTSSGISVLFESSPLIADSASAKIPGQDLTSIEDSVVSIDDSVVVQSARFSSGSLQIVLVNNLNINVGVRFVIDEFVSIVNGSSFTIDTTMQGKQTISIPMNANQLRIQASNTTQLGTWLTFSVGIKTINSEGLKKIVTKNDFVRVSIVPGPPMIVQSIIGKITPMIVNVNSVSKSTFNLGELKDKLTAQFIFKGMKLNLYLPITGGFPADYNLKLIAKNSKMGQTKSIDIPPTSSGINRIYPNQGIPQIELSNVTVSNFDDFTSFFGQSFPDLPDSFFVRGQLVINPLDVFQSSSFYTIEDTSKLYPSFDLNFPSVVGIANGHLIQVNEFGGQGQVSKSFTRSIIDGTINFEFANRIPIAMSFLMRFLGINNLTGQRGTLLEIIPTDTIEASEVDGNGVANNPKVSKVGISLTGSDMDKLNQADSIYIRLDLETSNSGTQPVKMRKYDYIGIRASMNAHFTINKP